MTVTTHGGSVSRTRHSVHRYPYRIVDNSKEDGKVTHTFLLNATVNISRIRAEIFSDSSARLPVPTTMQWELGINSRGEYNRSETNHTQINLEANDSNSRYALTVSGAACTPAARPCYSRSIVASGGHVQSKVGHETPCLGLPAHVRVCGSDICGFGFS